jgi:cytoskeleton protein RodZ
MMEDVLSSANGRNLKFSVRKRCKLLTWKDSGNKITSLAPKCWKSSPIMESVASELKSQREKQNISLVQISEDTRISMRYLQSLEEGRYADLPGGIYNRAFLRAYCERLNIDQKEIIRRYEEEISSLAEKPPKTKVHIPSQKPSGRSNPFLIWSFILLLVAAAIFFNRKWFAGVFTPYFHTQAPNLHLRQAEPPPIVPPATIVPPGGASSGQFPPSASPTASTDAAHTASTPSGGQLTASPAANSQSLRLELIGTANCWVSLDHDGIQALRREVVSGEVLSFDATEKFFLILGNAGGIRLKINGKPLKPLGHSGEVRRLLIDEKTLPDLLDPNAG